MNLIMATQRRRHGDALRRQARPRAEERLGYRPELDGLRAIAVGMVIVYHYLSGSRVARGGFLGVDLFFVLSGFLITRLLLEEREATGGVALGSFYRRRAARLLPALAPVAAVVLLDAVTFRSMASTGDSVRGVAVAIGYVANWARVFGFNESPIGHTWSLSIEEQFYLVWPIALVVLARRGRRAVAIAAGALFLIATTQTAVRSLAGVDPYVLYNSTDTHGVMALMAGCLLAAVLPIGTSGREHRLGRASRVLFVPALAVLAVLQVGPIDNSPFYYRGGLALAAILFVVVIIHTMQSEQIAAALGTPLLANLGRLSYGIYLWHIPMFLVAVRVGHGPPNHAVRLVALALTLAAATASYHLVEQPLRRRLTRPRRSTEVAVSGPPAMALPDSA